MMESAGSMVNVRRCFEQGKSRMIPFLACREGGRTLEAYVKNRELSDRGG